MSTDIQIFTNQEFNKEIRAIEINGEPWFVGKDVAEALGYSDTDKALRNNVPDKYKLTRQISGSGQMRNMILINEAGLYKLVMRSRLPNAEKFSDWCCEEVLPQLRKTGMYKIGDKVPQTFLEALKLAVQKEEERLALEQKYIEAEERAKENQQVKHLYDTTVAKGKWYTAKNVADVMNIIGVGRTKLYDFLREIGLVTSKNEPIHKYIEMGLIRVDYYAEWLEQFVCVFSVKGIRYIFTKLVNAGKMPRDVTMEEWVKLCEDMKE